MIKRLFVIKNTTHYLNVKNYLSNKPKGENYVILTIGKFQGAQEFVEDIKRSQDLKLLSVINTKTKTTIFNYFLVIQNILKIKVISAKFSFFDEIIFTNYKNWIHHFIINQFKTPKLLLLSDGAGILLMAEWRKDRKFIPFESIPFNGNKFFTNKILGIKPINHLHFYSQIKIEIPEYDSLEVFRFNSSASNIVKKGKVYFIGSPLVELGHMSLEKQMEYLKSIKKQFEDADITYYAHRRERDEYLEKYSFFGKVVRSNIPFEERMESEIELPEVIVSYLSSVLINLTPVYHNIKFFYFPLKESDIANDSNFLLNYLVVKKSFEKIRESNFNQFPQAVTDRIIKL